jgi:hypothetical protein
METAPPTRQGRARGLYDEQLQRQRQEKLLFRDSALEEARALIVRPEETPR